VPTTQQLLTQWFLTWTERGNPSTRLDARHLGGAAWTEGNMVRPLIHGSTYFAQLHRRVSQMRDGDLLMFVDWRGDPDERLTGSPDTEVGRVFADAARRGVDVRGLVWRSHWDRLAFSAAVAGLLRRSPDGAVCRSLYGAWSCGCLQDGEALGQCAAPGQRAENGFTGSDRRCDAGSQGGCVG